MTLKGTNYTAIITAWVYDKSTYMIPHLLKTKFYTRRRFSRKYGFTRYYFFIRGKDV